MFRLALHLPRDASTVPLVRRLLGQALRTVGVAEECRDDLCLILTEACANVIEHADAVDQYDISAEFTTERCVIEVVNAGAVVDPARLCLVPDPAVITEGGRGLRIIRALADEVRVTAADGGGLSLRAVTILRWDGDRPRWAQPAHAGGALPG